MQPTSAPHPEMSAARRQPTLISVITTVRNGSRYITETSASVLHQTYGRWEWIVVDDGSTDDTPARLRALAASDARIKIHLTDGIGRGPALNLAVSAATGDYVANLDADDLIHPRRLEHQLQAMQDHPGFALTGTRTDVILESATPVYPDHAVGTRANVKDVTLQLKHVNPFAHSSIMVRRAALSSVGNYSKERRSQLDYDLYVKLAEKGYALGQIQHVLAYKRLHTRQSFERRDRVRYLWSSARVQLRAIHLLGADIVSYVLLIARFSWGLLPPWLRARARQLQQQPEHIASSERGT